MLNNIAIIHYHLQLGGVSKVVVNHLNAIDKSVSEPINVLLIANGDTTGIKQLPNFRNLNIKFIVLEELSYDSSSSSSDKLTLDKIEDILYSNNFKKETSVLHIHNHSLGKNSKVTDIVTKLAEKEWRMLLQIHDFCEDNRPREYSHLLSNSVSHKSWYPNANHIYYSTLNQRDCKYLKGADVRNVVLLPNPILPIPKGDSEKAKKILEEKVKGRKYFLYPVRGIARKNIGEFVLRAALSYDDQVSAITLAPENKLEKENYNYWKKLSKELCIDCLFDTGNIEGLSFVDHMAYADAILTTSVTEGFGMAFLESAILDKPIIGRNLPEITEDFIEKSIEFPYLKNELFVPVEWIDKITWQKDFISSYKKMLGLYGKSMDDMGHKLETKDKIDFAKLNKKEQTSVIKQVAKDKSKRNYLRELNGIEKTIKQDENITEKNKNIVLDEFGMENLGNALMSLYNNILQEQPSKVTHDANPEELLKSFLSVEKFCPIRITSLK